MGEENEPEDIEKDWAEEKNCVGTAETLTAAFNGDESEQSNGQVDQRNAIVQRSEWTDQRTTNLPLMDKTKNKDAKRKQPKK